MLDKDLTIKNKHTLFLLGDFLVLTSGSQPWISRWHFSYIFQARLMWYPAFTKSTTPLGEEKVKNMNYAQNHNN